MSETAQYGAYFALILSPMAIVYLTTQNPVLTLVTGTFVTVAHQQLNEINNEERSRVAETSDEDPRLN